MHLNELIGTKLYFDSNILILAVEPEAFLRNLFRLVAENGVNVVTSKLTLTEILAKPFRNDTIELAKYYLKLVTEDGPIIGIPIDREILLAAARLRAAAGVKLADSIHLATAHAAQCDYLVTFDERLGRALAKHPAWLRPSDLIA